MSGARCVCHPEVRQVRYRISQDSDSDFADLYSNDFVSVSSKVGLWGTKGVSAYCAWHVVKYSASGNHCGL